MLRPPAASLSHEARREPRTASVSVGWAGPRNIGGVFRTDKGALCQQTAQQQMVVRWPFQVEMKGTAASSPHEQLSRRSPLLSQSLLFRAARLGARGERLHIRACCRGNGDDPNRLSWPHQANARRITLQRKRKKMKPS